MNLDQYPLLKTELLDSKYDGLSRADKTALVRQGSPALGRIEGSNRRNLITVINGNGLRRRHLAVAENSETPDNVKGLAYALYDTLDPVLVMQPDFSINLGDAEVYGMFQMAVSAQLLSEAERLKIELISTYYKSNFPSVTERDVYLAENDLFNATLVPSASVLYYGIAEQQWYVNNGSRISVFVSMDTPFPYAVHGVIKLRSCSDKSDHALDANYLDASFSIPFVINAGAEGTQVNFSPKDLGRYVKFDVEIDVTASFTVTVETSIG